MNKEYSNHQLAYINMKFVSRLISMKLISIQSLSDAILTILRERPGE